MKNFSFVDETIDINRTHSYILSIQLDLDGFSFSILDRVRNKAVVLQHYYLPETLTPDEKAGQIKKILRENKFFQSTYKKVILLQNSPKSIMIPRALFQEKYLKSYFEFNHPLGELEEIHYNHIEETNSYNIFTLPNPVSNAIIQHLKNVELYHQALPFIFNAINYLHSENKIVSLYLNNHFIDIGLFEENKMLLYNSFKISTKEDVLYFVLYIYKQLNLDTKSNELFISGNCEQINDPSQLFKRYIKKVHRERPPQEIIYSYTFKKPQFNYFTNLFRLNLCV
jgi:hypothetical protein